MLQSVKVPSLPNIELIYWKTPQIQLMESPYPFMKKMEHQSTWLKHIGFWQWSINQFPSKEDLPMEFPIGLNYSNLNGKVLLKADTGADVNTLKEATFKELFPRFPIDMLCPNDIELANYGNSGVNILGSIPLFIKWHGKVYKQTFHVTDANGSPNLLSTKSYFMMKILKPCFHLSSKKMSPSLVHSIQSTTDGKKQNFHLSLWSWNHSWKSKSWKHTRMFSGELELFSNHHINSSWNLMQFQQNILHRKFLFICRKPFTSLWYWNQWNIPLNGSIHMWS